MRRNVILLGLGALVAGMLFGILTLTRNQPASSTALEVTPLRTATPESTPVSAFLAVGSPTTPAVAATLVSTPTLVPTDTPIPPTPTPLPPTATPTTAAPVKTGSAPAPNVTAWSIAVIDEDSGALLYSRDPHRQIPPASLTKIFTALVTLEQGQDVHQNLTVQFDSTELVDSTLMGIKTGETYSLEDLLYGLMLPSGNDAALALANHYGGTEAQFATMMNAEASKIGLKDSHFVNAHGLDAPGHLSSAYDLGMAARYGMTHFPEFRTVAGTNAWDVHGTRAYTVYNLNRFLRSYAGADGVKIGYTDNSGKGIVASASRNSHRVYVALMHCGDIVNDSVPLFNWVFNNFTWPATPTPVPPTPVPTTAP